MKPPRGSLFFAPILVAGLGLVACSHDDRNGASSSAGGAASSSDGASDGGATSTGGATTASASASTGAGGTGGDLPATPSWTGAIEASNPELVWITRGATGQLGFSAIPHPPELEGTPLDDAVTLIGAFDGAGRRTWSHVLADGGFGANLGAYPNGDWSVSAIATSGSSLDIDPTHVIAHPQEGLVARLDANGQPRWATWLAPSTLGSIDHAWVWGTAVAGDRVWVAGSFIGTLSAGPIAIGSSPASEEAGFVVAFDAASGAPVDGAMLPGSTSAGWVMPENDGSLAAIGECNGAACLWRRSPGGVWSTRALAGSSFAWTGAMAPDGSVAIVGTFDAGIEDDGQIIPCTEDLCGFVAIVRPDGTIHTSTNEVGALAGSFPASVSAAPDGTWLVGGATNIAPTYVDVGDLSVTHLDSDGNLLATKSWTSSAASMTGIVAEPGGTMLVGGRFWGTPISPDWAADFPPDANAGFVFGRLPAP